MFLYLLFQMSEIAELLMINAQQLGGIRADLQSIQRDLIDFKKQLDSINSAIRYL